jgi:hypothetical protein
MRLHRTGVLVQFNVTNPVAPYEQWHGDALRCPECGFEIVGQWGKEALWRHHQGEDRRFHNVDVVVEDRPRVASRR